MSLVYTPWLSPTGGTIESDWVASDAPVHSPLEVITDDDSFTLINTTTSTDTALFTGFGASLPVGKDPLTISVKMNFGYGPVGGTGGG